MPVEAPWASAADEVVGQLETNLERGLSEDEAARRLEQYGANRIAETARRSALRMLLAQFADLMIGLLAVAAVISALIGEWADSVLIAIIVVANAIIGFVQEWRAENAVEALKRLSQPTSRVWRNGRLTELPAEEIVPGDLVEMSAGDFVPADGRLVLAEDLETDEAALTGESLPVEKSTQPVSEETVLPDRSSMVFTGTAVVRGHGRSVTTATGMQSELGNIAGLLETTERAETPLQRRLASLSRRLAIAVVGVSILIFAVGMLREDPSNWNEQLFSRMLLTAVSLAVAAIPEGLPAVITITLALGSQRMADRKSIIRRLPAVETLGSVNVICSDKTGTLTQNRMVVRDIVPFRDDEDAVVDLLTAAALCNDAEMSHEGELLGSATETALLQAAVDHGFDLNELGQQWERTGGITFSSARKRMSTLYRGPNGERILFAKGAAEQILARCTAIGNADDASELDDDTRKQWREKADEMADSGRRVLALALRPWDDERLPDDEDEVERQLRLVGLVGIVDPVRPEARESIARCRTAGIKPVMITGDHRGTARAIADELTLRENENGEVVSGDELDRLDEEGLSERAPRTAVYARVSPEHKLRIVKAYQSHDNVVAMTGDGVNDAPALKQADIGVAMGITGTDVAKESAAMVLADDNFATIVAAVEEGRVVYDNIRKFVAYLLTANSGEILVILFAILLGLPIPLLPVHILWINLVTDGLPALALGFEPAERNIMQRPPRRRDESIFAGGMVWNILLIGLLMAVACIILYKGYLPAGLSEEAGAHGAGASPELQYARTMVFLVLSMFQLFYVLAIRSRTMFFADLVIFANYRLTMAVIIGALLQLAVVYVPFLQSWFHTVAISGRDLLIGLAVSTTAFLAMEAYKGARRLSGSQPA